MKKQHEQLFNLIARIGDGKDLQLLKKLYMNQQAATARMEDHQKGRKTGLCDTELSQAEINITLNVYPRFQQITLELLEHIPENYLRFY